MLCFFIMLWIHYVTSNLYQISDKENKRLYLFKNRRALDENKPFKEEIYKDFKTCLSNCKLDKEKCNSIMIFKKNVAQDYSCKFFEYANITSVRDSTNDVLYLARKGGDFCGKHCHSLHSKRICGECKCVDSCGVTKKYHCNCTSVVPLMESCKDLSEKQISGWYLINPDQKGSFQVLCFIQKLEYSNRNISCPFTPNKFNYFKSADMATEQGADSEGDCNKLCYTALKRKNYNGWSFNNQFKICKCVLDAKALSDLNGWSSCIASLTGLVKNAIRLVTTVMMHREAHTEPNFWNRSLDAYYTGFFSADNYWIGLYQLERLSNKFTLDMKVVMVSISMDDTVTVYYRGMKVRRISDTFRITFNSFDSNNARLLGNFNKQQMNSSSNFQQCKSGGMWWTSCDAGMKLPTYPDKDFGFGNIEDIKSITFLMDIKK